MKSHIKNPYFGFHLLDTHVHTAQAVTRRYTFYFYMKEIEIWKKKSFSAILIKS